jgi:ferric-dicitrate binding protein FerR (iron transport regulator)
MSREERRAYQRQMKAYEKGPALPPAARARAERTAAKREARRSTTDPSRPLSRRFLLRATLVAVALGFLAFSVQWGEGMPRALYVGLAAAAITLAVGLGLRFLMTRGSRGS